MKSSLIMSVTVIAALSLVGCGGSNRTKGGGARDAAAAKTSNEKTGGTAAANQSKGTDKGADLGGITCDSALEGVGFCSSDTEIDFCAGGRWWVLNCPAVEAGAFCGLELNSNTVDCYVGL